MLKFSLLKIAILVIFLFPIFFVQMQQIIIPQEINCGSLKIPSTLQTSEVSKDAWFICLVYYLTRFLSFLYVSAMFLGVIFLAWAGILYMSNPEKTQEIHKRIQWGVVGLIVSILSLTIIKLIENFFLKL